MCHVCSKFLPQQHQGRLEQQLQQRLQKAYGQKCENKQKRIEAMEKSIRHEFFEIPWNFHKRIHLVSPLGVSLFVIFEDVTSCHLADQVVQKRHCNES